MPKLYRAKNIITRIKKHWFFEVSQKWSHKKFKNKSWKIVIIPVHAKEIPYWTFTSILSQAWIPLETAKKELK